MDETIEEDVVEEIKEEVIDVPIENVNNNSSINNNNLHQSNTNNRLSFSNIDYVKDYNNNITSVEAPKDIDRLEEINEIRGQQRKVDDSNDDVNNVKLNISDQHFELDAIDVDNIEEPNINLLPDLLIDDIEILD